MKLRWSIPICILLVAVAIMVIWPGAPAEPIYQGRPLSQHLGTPGAGSSGSSAFNVTQEEAIRAVGRKALPWFMYELGLPQATWRTKLPAWIHRLTRNRLRPRADRAMRATRAMMALRVLGPDAAPALPQLARHLAIPELSGNAAWVMAFTGEAGLPYLLKGVTSSNQTLAVSCGNALAVSAHANPATTPHLVALLQSPDAPVRHLAAGSLIGVTSHPELTIPALTACAEDPRSGASTVAANALHRLRLNPVPLVDELRQLMAGTNAALAHTASNALHLLTSPQSVK